MITPASVESPHQQEARHQVDDVLGPLEDAMQGEPAQPDAWDSPIPEPATSMFDADDNNFDRV